eukprot:TRINITY_DN32542_c0_g1_i1.p1 TRINITY_DN32542_c0_g1~~TRINITY_DN32542_c0_g1_i1.p1  ORF type:complete len:509 (-),score=98.25 TRINITY_DN32542_c0_g1_i1:48-1526(-)
MPWPRRKKIRLMPSLLPLLPRASWSEVFDTRCFQEAERAAAADASKCNLADPCRSDCWNNFFTHSYCCFEASDCWWWGQDAGGQILRVDAARSGVECRHICQGDAACAVWTFAFPAPERQEQGGPCLLRTADEGREARQQAPPTPGVVSGPRLCPAPTSADASAIVAPPVVALTMASAGSAPIFAAADLHDVTMRQGASQALATEGWAVLRQALSADEVSQLREASEAAASELIRRDPHGYGNRGPRRYSFGGASRTHHMVHEEAWARLLDNAAVSSVLQEAFGGPFVVGGGGGDFVLGSTDTHQKLHVDLQLADMYSRASPPAAIVANFVVSSIGCDDGPTRFIPRTQASPLMLAEMATQREEFSRSSSLEKEAAFLRSLGLTVVLGCPLEPGDVLLRDMRLWHGGTPNKGNATRLFPSAEFLSPWYAALTEGTDDHFAPRPALPRELWSQLSPSAREAARRLLGPSGGSMETGIRDQVELMLPYVAEDRP